MLVIDDNPEAVDVIVDELGARGCELIYRGEDIDRVEAACRNYCGFVEDRSPPDLARIASLAALPQQGSQIESLVLWAQGDLDGPTGEIGPSRGDHPTGRSVLTERPVDVELQSSCPITTRGTVLSVGPLKLDLIERMAERGGRTIRLLPREFRLLEYMMRRAGQVLTRAALLEDVWNYPVATETNVIDVHIGKLRKKVDLPSENRLIHCVRGTGFMLVALG
jgi:two-component system OmpR family response regulator